MRAPWAAPSGLDGAGAAFESFSSLHALQFARGGPFASTDRDTAWDHFRRSGPLLADWLWNHRFSPATPAPYPVPGLGLSPPLPGSDRVVFLNGRFEARLSTLSPVSGLWLRPACGLPWPLPKVDGASALVELNRALYEEAAAIEVAGRADAGVVEVLHLMLDPADGAMAFPRIQVHVENGARLTLVETFQGPHAGAYLIDAVTEVHLEPGARLQHVTVQDDGPRAIHLGGLQVRQEAGSVLSTHLFQVGAAVGRREVRLHLAGEGASAQLDGLFLTGAGRLHEHDVWIEHAAARCTSQQEVRGVARGDGRAVFVGHVRIPPNALLSETAQRARGLLLSPEAVIDFRPELELYTDDAKTDRSVRVEKVDPARHPEGPEQLVGPLAHETLETLAVPGLRERVKAAVAERMG
ncbi:MAG: SufD family Fe-S cluster assembly protein [Myxococcaceae bacterium]|nr:SufD family Fe-S cluster assembly protein [Myxococcaceae bacterium]